MLLWYLSMHTLHIRKHIILQLIRQHRKRRPKVHPLLINSHHPGQRVWVAEHPHVRGRIKGVGVRIYLGNVSDFGGAEDLLYAGEYAEGFPAGEIVWVAGWEGAEGGEVVG